MKEIILIEAPSNLGLKEPAPGVEPGVRFLPEALEKAGFSHLAGIRSKTRVPAPPYSMQLDKPSKLRNAEAIAIYSKDLSEEILRVIRHQETALVIGGDCSVMLGAMIALKQLGSYGLFHLDGHTDYMWPEYSQTGGVAGMGLAIAAGIGHEKLTNIDNLGPYINEENVYCAGNREYDDAYVELSLRSRMRYMDLEAIREHGPAKVAQDFLEMVDLKNLDGFWIHFDVDALNDSVMPCVDSRTPDGLWYDELKQLLVPMLRSPLFTGMEITILDPTLDPEGIYVGQFVAEMAGIITACRGLPAQ